MRLDGKVVLITGAGRGIGREAAQMFAAEGGQVTAADVIEPSLPFDPKVDFITLDVRKEVEWKDWFAQNFTEGFLAPDEHGLITTPTGDGLEPFIDLDDVAEVAVAGLAPDGPHGVLRLSGPEALSFGSAVEQLARAGKTRARFEPADPEAYRRALLTQMPAEYVAWRMAMFDSIRDGRDAYVSFGVEEVLGRPARAFLAQFAVSAS